MGQVVSDRKEDAAAEVVQTENPVEEAAQVKAGFGAPTATTRHTPVFEPY